MSRKISFIILILLIVSLLAVIVCAQQQTTETETRTGTINREPTENVKPSPDSVEPSYDEHGVFVTDGEEHDKESKPTATTQDVPIPKGEPVGEQQTNSPFTQSDVTQKNKLEQQNQEGQLFRRDPFRFVNGIWDEMNNEFKSMSTYMNDLFSDVLERDIFNRRIRDNNVDSDDDDEEDQSLFGGNRWAVFNKIFNDHTFDDDFDLPFFNRFWRNKVDNKKRIDDTTRGSTFQNKILKPLKHILKTENKDKTSNQVSNPTRRDTQLSRDMVQRRLFLGGITEGTKGYQVQLEVPDHLTKSDVKVSVRKVHENLSVVKIKGEKKYEKKIGSSENTDKLKNVEQDGSAEGKHVSGQQQKKEPESAGEKGTEKVYQSFERVFTIGRPILKENIEAKLENGILNVFIPKDENVKNEQSEYEVSIM